jgi:hypothetical protein
MTTSDRIDTHGDSRAQGVCRREFLKVAAVGLLAGRRAAQQPTGVPAETVVSEAPLDDAKVVLAGPCGLYCGICSDYASGECHGCGCECGGCAARYHHAECEIYRCAQDRELASCAACDQLPCTALVQFAYDPVWLTHGPVIENLRRIRLIGPETWVEEQEAYWSDRQNAEKWNYLPKKQAEAYKEFKAQRG